MHTNQGEDASVAADVYSLHENPKVPTDISNTRHIDIYDMIEHDQPELES